MSNSLCFPGCHLEIGSFTVSVFYDVSLKLSHCQCSDIKRSDVSHVGEEELGSCQWAGGDNLGTFVWGLD